MQISRNFLKIVTVRILLSLFLFKLTATIIGFHKVPKTGVALVNNTSENQEDPEKKNERKSSSNFNKEFDNLKANLINHTNYWLVSNPHPHFVPFFTADHFPPVPTPPPNC